MRILMLGWEFPPFIAGGLGVACYGLTRALDKQGHERFDVIHAHDWLTYPAASPFAPSPASRWWSTSTPPSSTARASM
jgi:hypothetical protein